jgi:hypothetical protein
MLSTFAFNFNLRRYNEEVDPTELIDFSGCHDWEDALRVGREATAALEHMQADGWTVDPRTWCNEAEHLLAGRCTQSPRYHSSFTMTSYGASDTSTALKRLTSCVEANGVIRYPSRCYLSGIEVHGLKSSDMLTIIRVDLAWWW